MFEHKNKRRNLAIFAVLLMLASNLIIIEESEESDAATADWKCTVTISDSTITTKYEKGGATLADTTPVNGISQTVGSWGFDENGYGPFNSFYAAFDPATGKMVCHLNPSNLKQAVDGTDISGKGYNIMWCLPKIYVSVSGSTLTMSSSSADGTLASAFTVGGTSYNYLAIGVYEATLNGTVLGSESGTSPKNSTSLADYRTYSKNAKVEGGVTLLWNYHMYELYRMCSLAVMENFDSQAQVGYGNASGSSYSQTGQTDGYGPYYGTSSASSVGAKLFIENAWGSLWEYVDDAWWSSGLYAGQNLNPTSDTSNKTKTTVKSGLNGYGKYPYSTQLDSWGLPTSTSSSQSSTAPDYFYSSSSGNALFAGGSWDNGAAAGLSDLGSDDVGGNSYLGSRLALLFNADPASPPAVSDGASAPFTYTITPDGNIVGNYTAIAGDAATSGSYTSSNGMNVGSWGFDSKGYGPFNSFYAAFDPAQNNKMICHLDPNDLTRSMDGKSISGKGYNIMWCLPTVYWSTDSSGNLILSNDPSKGTAYAHTIDGKVYKYIGIGVYEASMQIVNGADILTSTSGTTPLVEQNRATFRDYANNQLVNTAGAGNNGYAMVWNFYQWELYKYCALAVMGSWDSQGVAGNGSSFGTSSFLYYDTPGLLDASGPYAGTKGSVFDRSYNQDPVKVFIENAWGSVFDFVDGVVINGQSGYTIDQSSVPGDSSSTTSSGNITYVGVSLPGEGYGSSPSTNVNVWGMPTANGGSETSGLYDFISTVNATERVLCVGGFSLYSDASAPVHGLSYTVACYDLSYSSNFTGGRLAFVFDADPVGHPTVTLDHSNLTAEGGVATGFITSIDITDGATYPDLNTVTDNPSIIKGWIHTGWEVGDATYLPGDRIEITESHIAKSLWAAPSVIFDHSALSDIGGNTDGLPLKVKIDDLTDGYPDLNTYTGNSSIQDGYVHVGWHVDGKFYAIGTPIVHDTTHTAYSAWVVPQILITFMVEGEIHSTLSVPKNSVGVVYTPVMVEGVFEGWFYDPEYTDKYDSSRPLDRPTTLYAKGVPPLVFTSVPTADATIAPVDYKGLFFFDATGSSGRYQVHWDFGDGNTSDEPIAYNTYTEPGRYTVKLIVTNIYGEQAESEYVVDLRDGTATDNMKWFAVGALCVIAAGLVIRRIL